jgi:sugar phosphate isomerase/epimerase
MTRNNPDRRSFLQTLLTVPAMTTAGILGTTGSLLAVHPDKPADKKPSLKLSLNAYSFNKQLLDGSMTINDMLEFAAEAGLMAVDITGYYFKGYPEVPTDEVIFNVKRKAFSLGLEICGTGVRNDFTHADPAKRSESVQLVKNWIEVSQKLGGQTLRIFSGNQKPDGYTREQILEWMVKDIRECVEYGKAHGVVVALQNHDDFLKTAGETIQIMEAIKSPWYGLMLDIGSFRTADPYEEIAQTIRYAVTWQIKEKVFVRGKEVDVDADKLMQLIKASGFRGYLPLETLGEGDPKQKVPALLNKFIRTLRS